MAINPDIRDEAFLFFVQEAPELLQIIEAELLEICQECTTERVHALMRAAHTIKGGSANVGLEAIKAIAHRLEDYFRCLYNSDLRVDEELERLFLQAYDCLRNPLLEAIQVGDQWEGGEAALTAAEPIFAQLQERLADFVTDEDHLPSVAEMGIDIAQSIFETDVAQALERLETIEGDEQIIGGELRAQAEVFEGIAELLNLPGLTQIAHLVLSILDTEPHRSLELFPIALENFKAAHQAVLEGDRTQGGTPSVVLQTFAHNPTSAPATDELWLSESDFANESPSWFEAPDLEDEASGDSFFGSLERLAEEEGDRPLTNAEDVFSIQEPPILASEDTDLGRIFSIHTTSALNADDADLESIFSLDDTSVVSPDHPELESIFGSNESLAWGSDDTNIEQISSINDTSTPDLDNDNVESIFITEGSQVVDLTDSELETTINRENTLIVDEDYNTLFANLEQVFGTEDSPLLVGDSPSVLSTNLESVFGSSDEPSSEVWPASEDPVLEGSLPETRFPETPSGAVQANPEPVDAEPAAIDKTTLIESAITAIEQGFDQLPMVSEPVPIEVRPTEVETAAKTKAAQPVQPTVNANQISVRLNLDQLERISNQLGELSINRNSLSLQNEQLQETLQELRRRFGQFLAIGTQLQVHLNKLLISPDRYQKNYVAAMQERSPASTLTLEKGTDLSYRAAFDTLELDRYNEVYNLLQEATESIQQLDEAVEDVTLFAEQSDRGLEQQRQILTVLRDELMWARMLPLGNILNRFPRQIKELSYQYKKPVALKLTGTEVLVDKVVLEKLYDPLLHLLRNAFDHGIESAEDRKQQGKPEQGTIHIRVYHRGSRTVIEIEDDGRGINFERIRTKAIENGILTAEIAKTVSSERLLNLIFEPGFSTAAQVSELSGRGVGLDIVRAQIQSLKGSISVNSKPGKGTIFTLRIPLTLSISKLLLTWSGSSLAAIPSDSIEEIVNPNPRDIKTAGNQPFLYWRHQVIPIHPLQDLLPFNCVLPTVEANLSFNSVPTPEEWAPPLLILRQGNQPFALQVERLITEQELVVKPFSDTLPAPAYLYGCTILGDGSVVPVVDAVTLLLHRQGNRATAIAPPSKATPQPTQSTPTILIVDDAATMRQMLTLTLKKAGYQVIQARDGREALDQLHQHPQIRLVICDIEMPTMNGFEFLTHRRQTPTLLNIPVIMLTSRSGEKHRKLALHLGATNYFTKPYIEQQFLGQINTLLQPSPNS